MITTKHDALEAMRCIQGDKDIQEILDKKFSMDINNAFDIVFEALGESNPSAYLCCYGLAGYGDAKRYCCSACGSTFSKYEDEDFSYCPMCGKKLQE